MILKIFEYTKDFPREYKFTLEQFLDDFEILKLEIRLCVDLKIMSIKKQSEISLLMEGIGKQITGWRNAGLYSVLNKKYDIYPLITTMWNTANLEINSANRIVLWGYSLPATDFYANCC